MSEPCEMSKRPPIRRITYISAEGNPCVYDSGCGGVRFHEVLESGEYSFIPWVEVWRGEDLLARFNQHKLEHILY